jgi:hypothetical protein
MKKIQPLLAGIALCSALSFLSCKKFLSPAAASSFDTEFIFDNIPNARAALLGAYGAMAGDYGYGIRISGYYGYDTDEGIRGSSMTTTDEGQLLAHYAAIVTNTNITNPFNQMYQGVERANLCIYNIPKMDLYTKGTDLQKSQLRRMYGEALTLRAQFLYELCRDWGNVPVQWEPSHYQTDLFQPRTSRDTIYTHLINDLALAGTLLPWRTEVSSIGDPVDQRFTRGSAKALRAKIALTRGGYSLDPTGGPLVRASDYLDYYKIAHDECQELVNNRAQHTLLPSYKSLYRDYLLAHNLNDPAGEFMMVASMALGSGTDSKLGIQTGTRVNGVGGGSVLMNPSYFYLFDSTDTRRDVSCVPYEITFDTIKTGHAINAIYDGKFRKEWVSNPGFTFSSGSASVSTRPATNASLQNMQLSWPLIRFADVLLWYAETENELNNGPTPVAIAAVQEVDRRGHGGAYTTEPAPVIPTDKDGFFKFLVKERLLEFGNEGVRKYDLIRWNLLATAVSETRARLQAWANATATSHPAFTPYSYMADGPVYARDASQLPTYLYFYKTPPHSDIYDFNPFLNSYYKQSSTAAAPAGQTRVNWWLGGSSSQTFASTLAFGFITGKSEVFPIPQAARDANPNLTQNNGY